MYIKPDLVIDQFLNSLNKHLELELHKKYQHIQGVSPKKNTHLITSREAGQHAIRLEQRNWTFCDTCQRVDTCITSLHIQ